MSAKAVSEYAGKELLYRALDHIPALAKPQAVQLLETTDFAQATLNCEWLRKEGEGVVKPDQLIKRRGKHGLVKIGKTAELQKWFDTNKGQYIQIGKTYGRLSKFISRQSADIAKRIEIETAKRKSVLHRNMRFVPCVPIKALIFKEKAN